MDKLLAMLYPEAHFSKEHPQLRRCMLGKCTYIGIFGALNCSLQSWNDLLIMLKSICIMGSFLLRYTQGGECHHCVEKLSGISYLSPKHTL